MPSWIKKRFRDLKQDLLNNLTVLKSKKQLLPAATNNETITIGDEKLPIKKIRNDLRSNRFRGKSDMNAYRDYAKWRDQVLTNHNNCALRCVREEKLLNSDVIPITSTINDDDIIETECRHNSDNKPVSLSTNDGNNGNCDSESE